MGTQLLYSKGPRLAFSDLYPESHPKVLTCYSLPNTSLNGVSYIPGAFVFVLVNCFDLAQERTNSW